MFLISYKFDVIMIFLNGIIIVMKKKKFGMKFDLLVFWNALIIWLWLLLFLKKNLYGVVFK